MAAVTAMASSARWQLDDLQVERIARDVLESPSRNLAIQTFLGRWCQHLDQPLVLLLDEVDTLVGDTLLSLLRQLRAGYNQCPAYFPNECEWDGLPCCATDRSKSSGTRRPTGTLDGSPA